jgi:hypothetical protein
MAGRIVRRLAHPVRNRVYLLRGPFRKESGFVRHDL